MAFGSYRKRLHDWQLLIAFSVCRTVQSLTADAAVGIFEDMGQLPTGTVTFLFTDIAGSTRRWQEDPSMSEALAHHDGVLQTTIGQHGGILLKHTGDGTVSVFESAGDAVEAAVDAQKDLATRSDGVEALRVRMAIHTGEAEERDGDYFGPALNMVARLMDLGHGEQILVSRSTAEILREQTSEPSSLIDLGRHHLKDLNRPVRVFQLAADGIRTDFPPLRSSDADARVGSDRSPTTPTNLPSPMQALVGRADDLESIRETLSHSRLVTLTGTGGVGKTTLAIESARNILEENPDGVWFVDLARVTDPNLVAREVASVLGVSYRKAKWVDAAAAVVRGRTSLLVLDNCEHLLEVVAPLVERLLRESAGLRVLATSREPLGLPGESICQVEALRPEAATNLLVESAKSAGAGDLRDADPAVLASLCERLDRLPLAIQLAASRLRHLSLQEILDRLDERFDLLTTGTRTALPRHKTLEATVDWSYDLLVEDEQHNFRSLCVFPGGFDLETAESICGEDALPTLESLVDKSLVAADISSEHARYRMLETIRSYGRRRLVEAGEEHDALDAQLAWARGLASEARRGLAGPEAAGWIAHVDSDIDNLHSAMQWSIDRPDPTSGLFILGALHEYWDVKAIREGAWWSERLLPMADANTDTRTFAWASMTAGLLQGRMGDNVAAQEYLERAERLHTESGNLPAAALTSLLQTFFVSQEAWSRRMSEIDKALEVFRSHGANGYLATGLTYACGMAAGNDQWDLVEQYMGELEETIPHVSHPRVLAHFHEMRGRLLNKESDTKSAAEALVRALDAYRAMRSRLCTTHCLVSAANWAVGQQSEDVAARLIGAVSHSVQESGWDIEFYRLERFQHFQDDLPEVFESGSRLDLSEAVDYARSELTDRLQIQPGADRGAGT